MSKQFKTNPDPKPRSKALCPLEWKRPIEGRGGKKVK